jgi:hypothetical protein
MQPRCRQVPPTLSFSISATDLPSSAARAARGVAAAAAAEDRVGGRAYRDGEVHLTRFAQTRTGVEAFVEPRTAVTDTTIVLVAASGEWTRRPVPGPQAAHQLAHRLGIPAYDAGVVGYPQRMRDWNSRLAAEAKARREP